VIDRVPIARRLLGGTSRYALSVALRSMPRFVTQTRPHVVVTNAGAPAIEMSKHGATGRTIVRGATIWEGACTLAAGATIPFFGFGLKMFSFAAARPNTFQLRCGDAGLLEILTRAPAAFRGDYFSEHVADFLCDRVIVELETDAAIEAGGELLGRHRRVELALGEPATIISLASS
jgi:hypothetical protein